MKKFTAALIAFSFLVAPVAQAAPAGGAPKPQNQIHAQAPKPGQPAKPGANAPKPGQPGKPGPVAQKPGQPPKPGQAPKPGQPGFNAPKPGQPGRPGFNPPRPGQPGWQWQKGHRYGDWRKHPPVHDYHRYGLRRPGPGQYWIRVGNQFLLVGITTGIIAGIIAASR